MSYKRIQKVETNISKYFIFTIDNISNAEVKNRVILILKSLGQTYQQNMVDIFPSLKVISHSTYEGPN